MKINVLLALCLASLLWAGSYNKANAQTPSDGLELHLPFNGNTKDFSGTERHGISEGAELTTDRFGNTNSAYAFDEGANISVPNFSSAGFKGVTICTWIKTSKTSPQQQVIQGIVGVLYVNWIKTGHFMAAFDGTAGNNKPGEVSKTYVADGKWHHVAASNDGSKTRVFVDGVLETIYDEPLLTGVRDIQIGGGTWFFTGSMDDIRIYSRALPPTEVKAIYNGTASAVNEAPALVNELKLYPNPATNNSKINIQLPANPANGHLSITTITGQTVYAKNLSNLQQDSILQIDTKHFPAGIYMVNLISGEKTSTSKLIIQ